MEGRHQRGHVALPETAGAVMRRCPLALTPPLMLASALDTSARMRWQCSRKALPLVRERELAGGAQHQLHAQALFQCIEAAAHDGGSHAFCLGGGGEAATRSHRDEALAA